MHVTAKTFWLPKRGNSIDEYEDAAYPFEFFEAEVTEFKCAVADGATETSFAALWAQLLVEGFAQKHPLKEMRARWNADVRQRELPWYAEEKLEKGAYAALAGLYLKKGRGKKNPFSIDAIGDCCIFHVRENQMLSSFPMVRSQEFHNAPALICSHEDARVDAQMEKFSRKGEWKDGDSFFLLTDAIACWALRREEEMQDLTNVLQNIETQDDFCRLVDEERQSLLEDGRAAMKNDDVTLLCVTVCT
jgi:hypothetical protein